MLRAFLQSTVPYISLPKGLPTKLVQSTRELKAVAVWYQLKTLRVCGVIKDFGRNAKAIAATFGYSERKLRTYVAYLTQRGHIERPDRHTLVLRSSRLLSTEYGVAKRCHKIGATDFHQLELVIQELALTENIERQAHTVKGKLQEQYLRNEGIPNSSNLQPAAKKRLMRGFNLAQEMEKAASHFVATVSTLALTPTLNPFVTLSRGGIARALGRRSKATGFRYAQKLRAAGLLTEQKHRVFVCDASVSEYYLMRASGYDSTFIYEKGKVYKALSNLLTLSSLVQKVGGDE
jgi:hypothetical protein